MKHLFRSVVFMFVLCITAASTQAQIRKIPASATDAFKAKYPNATGAEWHDDISVFTVKFLQDDVKHVAKYSTKGKWIETENELSEDNLPPAVKEGFSKCKYADWQVLKIHKIVEPDKTQYRMNVKKADLNQKNLLFNSTGKLLKDNVTL
jgi:hypothetical protein